MNISDFAEWMGVDISEIESCMITFEDTCKELQEIEAKLAIRTNYNGFIGYNNNLPVTIRENLIYIDIINDLEEDELVRDWQQNLSSYLNWVEDDVNLYNKYIEFKVFTKLYHYQTLNSFSFIKNEDENYIEILNLGKIAITAILKYIEHFHWVAFSLLYEITKYENIFVPQLPNEHHGKLEEVKNHWLNWGKGEGFIE